MVFILALMSVFIFIKGRQANGFLIYCHVREGEKQSVECVLFNYSLIVVVNVFLIKMNMLHVKPPLPTLPLSLKMNLLLQ